MNSIALLLSLLFFSGCHGNYLFDLFSIFKINPSTPTVKDLSAVTGPLPGSTAVKFGPNADRLLIDGNWFAYLAAAFYRSEDISFSTRFKLTVPTSIQKTLMCLFSMEDDKHVYEFLSIGFEFRVGSGVTEEGKLVNKTTKASQYFKLRYRGKGDTTTTFSAEYKLDDAITSDKWYTFIFRLKKDKLSVSIDCKEVVNTVLERGSIQEIPFQGFLSLGRELGLNNQFVGSLYNPQIMDSEESYSFFNPCDADLSVQNIPSEPLISQYDTTKFEKFVALTSNNVKPVVFVCVHNGTRHFSGTRWRIPSERCKAFRCENGKVIERYICPACKDGTKIYKQDDTWIKPDKPCQKYECDNGITYEAPIGCKSKTCNSFGMVKPKPKGVCCDVCYSETCKKGWEYYKGCERKCGASSKCANPTNGCWCPKRYALDENNQCIKISSCPCQSGNKVYQPGQTVLRSKCQTCVCASGTMNCLSSCF